MSENRSVVVSGVSSFVGMHLALGFADAGWKTTALLSRPLETYKDIRLQRLKAIENKVIFRTCDITSPEAIEETVKAAHPDLWIHHGGFAENYHSADYDLARSLEVNVLALKPLYQTLAKSGAGVLITGSSMEYGSSNKANQEEDACWPETPYGLSKLTETIEAKRLASLYGIPTRVARLYIPVGKYDAPGKLMDLVTKKLSAAQPVNLSPCTQKRDFLGVQDIANLYLKMADDLSRQPFDIFNVCSGEATELQSLVKKVCTLLGMPLELLNFGAYPMRPGEPMSSYGANDKAKSFLNWEPRPIEDALLEIIKD